MQPNKSQQGSFLPGILVFATVALILLGVILSYTLFSLRSGVHFARRTTSIHIAEAGVNYYLWHLSHDRLDFKDGQVFNGPAPYGPFVHQYKNASGDVVGTYSLMISPPDSQSTSVTVKSTGLATGTGQPITIEAKISTPSFSQYAWLLKTQAYFGTDAVTKGKIHSNDGIRFEGHAYELVSAANREYQYNCNNNSSLIKPGVWGSGTFDKGTAFPVTPVDFNKVTTDLTLIKTNATSGGIFLPYSFASGYHLYLKANPNKIDVYKVTNVNQNKISKETFVQSYDYPSNGLVFVEDNLYLEGTVNGRMTLASANLSGTARSVYLTNSIKYTAYDGTVALGVISQKDIVLTRYINQNPIIDGAYLAQTGGIGYSFSYGFNNKDNGKLTTHGALASALGVCSGHGMSRYNGNGDVEGFSSREYNYDENLLLNPPPFFPTTGTYSIISWRQL